MTDIRDSAPDAAASATNNLALAEARVEEHSASLKKELGVRDLALTQILFIVGLTWIGVAGKLGPAHVVFWLVAFVLFFIPLAMVVTHLNRLMPLEGGLYEWARLAFGDKVGSLRLNDLQDTPRAFVPLSCRGVVGGLDFSRVRGGVSGPDKRCSDRGQKSNDSGAGAGGCGHSVCHG